MKRMNKIEYGDKIFARLTMGQRTIVEFMINRVADMTELLAELRRSTAGIRGLATLHIRNQSKGWSAERPLMLYANPSQSSVSAAEQVATAAALRNQMILGHYNL